MGAKLGSSSGPMADINVTPLIDVVLVLLVVFMVITPMLQAGLPVDLPKATQAEVVNDIGQFIVISVTETKGVWVEAEQISDTLDIESGPLLDALNAEYRDNPTVNLDGVDTARSLLVKADRDLTYGDVRKVLDVLAENKMTSVLVAAEKEK
ncbi:MAG: biopolymer transporter ExbD [Alphaproteobacteria bacterium]|nr:biopolymer transporter ExbD [Alphaproteobacteria bacterium]